MSAQDHPLDVELDAELTFRVWMDLEANPPRMGVAGELDLLSCAPFRDALMVACEKHAGVVVLDFSQLRFLGSTGIRELVRALAYTDRLEIHSPAPAVRKVLEMVNLGPRVSIIPADGSA